MYIVRTVETSIPPTTATPIAIRWLHPSPDAKARGMSPRTVAALVMRIGRRRSFEASRTAVSLSCPSYCFWLANSTISIPFLATRPMSMIMPI